MKVFAAKLRVFAAWYIVEAVTAILSHIAITDSFADFFV